MEEEFILVRGARQNNLKNIDAAIPLGKLTVVTGVSGSGKSSFAFDTVYAEGQRRYVETFSAYTRQFLDRMDRPRVDRISGIPPAVAIDASNPVRTSRSTVGTMTELADHLRLLFARAAKLYCRSCGRPVRRDTPESAARDIGNAGFRTVMLTFTVPVSGKASVKSLKEVLAGQGYTRYLGTDDSSIEVVQDRLELSPENRSRLVEDLEASFRFGKGRVAVHGLAGDRRTVLSTLRFSSDFHCAACDIHYTEPHPGTFSFNSPVGACPACRGFGRVIDFDMDLVVPDGGRTLCGGAVKPWQTDSFRECQEDLEKFARKRGVPLDVPWRDLDPEHRAWVTEGEGPWDDGVWYGVRRFFKWLESKSYRMHIRVLLSKYRAYRVCPGCGGARLKEDALLWRVGGPKEKGGLSIHEINLLPLGRCREFFDALEFPPEIEETVRTVMAGITSRLAYLVDVGLAYLTLDRQTRTLSGGEVQRINLTTALGISLVNTLFVLDEPSIGLHSRDIRRLIGVLHNLRDAGNTLLVVEHDPEVIRAADHVIDIGPGAGERGGEIVFSGGLENLARSEKSATAPYLSGKMKVAPKAWDRRGARPGFGENHVTVVGAAENNLKNIDVSFPLGGLVCVTGVSGSGKSTLVEDVLHRALRRLKGRAGEAPGAHAGILGGGNIDDAVLVDQSPIGRTARSNPASYVGAMDGIRKIFAARPEAAERGYGSGHFSFNSGAGRCPTCGGSGFEHVEMQFLSDVYLRCPDCDGRRFRREILEIRVQGADGRFGVLSIAEVLDLTVREACEFFRGRKDVLRGLESLTDVGLGYLRLGQAVPTLSGGEAQRLKIAGYLAESAARKSGRLLFLLDEPTTGLHFQDISVLLGAFDKLVAAGHSLLVIEHNLDVIASADHVVDLGPEGGDGGGRITAAGTPRELATGGKGHTAEALRRYFAEISVEAAAVAAEKTQAFLSRSQDISIRGAREHNLKNISLTIPRDAFTVITGVSGSGKSTVAFDILFAEGQRRYLESLNAYARQFVQPAARPEIDDAAGIPPTVAIEQRTSRGGRKSTVATVTEIYHFLRLLFVRLGVRHCPDCGVPIVPESEDSIVSRISADFAGREAVVLAPLVTGRKGLHADAAKRAAARGQTRLRVDGTWLPVDPWPRLDRYREHTIDLPVASLRVPSGGGGELRGPVREALDIGKGTVKIASPDGKEAVFSTLQACPSCGKGFPDPDPRLFSYNSKHGWCPVCFGTGLRLPGFDAEQTGEEIWWNAWYEGEEVPCPACGGRRLRPEALAVTFRGLSIAEICAFSVDAAEKFFAGLRFEDREARIARDITAEIVERLRFLSRVGLSYITLDRAAPTLSGGESRRIRLAAQLGSNLRGVCYILDEPTIGLHSRDNAMLLETLALLKDKGNTVVTVEHDEETIRRGDYIIDLGPGGGVGGGEVIAAGTLADILKCDKSRTAACLRTPPRHPLAGRRRPVDDGTRFLVVEKPTLHNLRGENAAFPLERLTCVTGVSGSGKSTLVRDILLANAAALLRRGSRNPRPVGCAGIRGWEGLSRVLEVDQTPIGKTPRSCPATYIGFWDDIRRLFAETPESKMRGYAAGRFSFNVPGGRCPACEGQGIKKIEMSFLPDVTVVCDVCGGERFDDETREISFKGRTIADVLRFSAEEALDFFSFHPRIHRSLALMCDVGLGYVALGRQSPTLSGGEAQRIKLVAELAKADPRGRSPNRGPDKRTLYILDEPTVGLHMADVELLVRVLHRLVDAGGTVVVIEHNLDIVAEADWVLDLGPEGGDGGGRITVTGTPETVSQGPGHTARYLGDFLSRRSVSVKEGPRTAGENS